MEHNNENNITHGLPEVMLFAMSRSTLSQSDFLRVNSELTWLRTKTYTRNETLSITTTDTLYIPIPPEYIRKPNIFRRCRNVLEMHCEQIN